jgi:EAL domain-containing protein (putative c-di-GMP-specific phosphodiesterase class I)/CHASE2 domain-containing sensor protein
MNFVTTWWGRVERPLQKSGAGRLPVILCAALVGVVAGLGQFGSPVEDMLRSARNLARSHDASGQVVIIALDDKSLTGVQKWPWPRRYHAKLVDNLTAMGARRIFFDIEFSSNSNAKDDAILAGALARSKTEVTLANLLAFDPVTGTQTNTFPIPEFRRHARQATINLGYEEDGSVWKIPYGVKMDGTFYPSFAASLAGSSIQEEQYFRLDHAIRPESIPSVSAIDVLDKSAPVASIAGKDVVIGAASMQLADIFNAPGHGLISGVYLHAIAAETLMKGRPTELSWLLMLSLAALMMTLASSFLRGFRMLAGYCVVPIAILAGATILEHFLIVPAVLPALLTSAIGILIQSVLLLRQRMAERASVNPISGLPNLKAFRDTAPFVTDYVIVARVHNFTKIVASLPDDCEKELVRQIAARLSVGRGDSPVFQSDDGTFITLFARSDSVEDHASALHNLFREPVTFGPTRFDLIVTLGVDGEVERPLTRRLADALNAADEAFGKGLKWKMAVAEGVEDTEWHLSLLGQLDEAIERKHMWVAYQPKLDLASGRLCGAEALVRWAHPKRGNISPIEFIQAAEQSGRIDRLTAFVMDDAIGAAAALAARGTFIDMSVNLSARMLGDDGLVAMVSGLLHKHSFPPERLILEITETAAIDASRLAQLTRLRELGVGLSIDDYGTGLSTLEYLKCIPATEIKIDGSFVQNLSTSMSDRLMVSSTINLAHALGRRVVAEGVEDPASLEALSTMQCDEAQGYYIGRPMPLRQLYRALARHERRQAA